MKKYKIIDIITEYKDIIETFCSIISVIIIGVASVIISFQNNNIAIQSNTLIEKQNELSMLGLDPYFTLEVNNDENEYIINNNGGFIQNVNIVLTRMICLINRETNQTIYIPYRVNEEYYFDLKSNSFSIKSLHYISGLNDNETDLLYSEFHSMENNIVGYFFDLIKINYIDTDHLIRKSNYLVGEKEVNNIPTCFLIPLNCELEEEINNKTPYELKTLFLEVPHYAKMYERKNTYNENKPEGWTLDLYENYKVVIEKYLFD